tara:strand:- start:2223 stop:4418 length:2196 start_codon:yes stop_codon:yes gene_type:complete
MEFNIIIALSFLYIPIFLFLYQLFFGHLLKHNTWWISIAGIGINLAISLSLFYQTFLFTPDDKIISGRFNWLSTGNFNLDLGLLIDNMAAFMLLVVSLVSFLVHLYSSEYMKGDSRFSRYYAFLGLFTFSMNGIVLADSITMIYIFWELVGLSSYLIIGFWFEKNSAAMASKKAFLTNRVGDIGMFIGIMMIYFVGDTHSFNLDEIIEKVKMGGIDTTYLSIAGVLIFMGAVGKSAQLPLHIWLPDAMEGPTPASAMIHAATMVAAGVYMALRIFPILTFEALTVIAFIGASTAIFAAIIAITQNDIKKVLAYSTVSQLGYMVLAIGVGSYLAAFFHLVTHAMFKACLFMASGSVIHSMHHSLHELHDHDTDPQDMRNMGGLKNKMPITYAAMLITTLAIAGVPFFSGFVSKDAILAGTLAHYFEHGGYTVFLPLAGFGAAAITAFYMFRLIFLTFHGKPANEKIYEHIHESPSAMTIPLIVLSALSFSLFYTGSINPLADGSYGWFAKSIGIGHNYVIKVDDHHNHQSHEDSHSHTISDKSHYNDEHHDQKSYYNEKDSHENHGFTEHVSHAAHAAHYTAMYLSLFVASLGILFSFTVYFLRRIDAEKLYRFFNIFKLYNLSKNKFYIDEIYSNILYKPFMFWSKTASKIDWDFYDQKGIDSLGKITLFVSDRTTKVDYDWLDQIVVDGFGKIANFMSLKFKNIQGGIVQSYILGGLVALILIILFVQQI